MGRTILAVIAGVVVAWLTINGLHFLSHALWPPPPGLDPMNPDHLAQIIAQAPFASMVMLVVAWAAGSFTGAFTAAKISHLHKRAAAIVIALFVMAGVGGMIYMIPEHPVWVSVLGFVLPIPVALLAGRLCTQKS